MQHILYPTDFSRGSLQALQFAVQLARANKSKITVHHAYYSMPQEIGLDDELAMTLIQQAKTEAEEGMKNLESLLAAYPDLEVNYQVDFGFASDSIAEAAANCKADIIIMATKGAKNILERFTGTVTMSVAEKVSIPLLAIPHHHNIDKIEELLYATGYEEADEKNIETVLHFANLFNARVQAVYIIGEHELHLDSVEKLTEKFRAKFAGKPIHFKNLHRDDVTEGLETYISNRQPDVLVLAHHHRNFLEGIFNPSVTRHFAYQSQLPILICPVID